MIVTLAGHVDHGKTALVHALTGVDTDRLEEEKKRGLTIELGFAYGEFEGVRVGFVDVPGHHRFIRNMIAGVRSEQFALFVIAADEGPMPQTEEHLDILETIGLSSGIIAMTRVDLADEARRAESLEATRSLIAGTFLENAEILWCSARSGEGIDDLKRAIATAARSRVAKLEESRADERHFRLCVDRAFSLSGAGLIVTGAVHSGCLREGESVVTGQLGRPVRVRSIRVSDQPADFASYADRAALNLTGLDAEQVSRGDWILAAEARRFTNRVSLRFRAVRHLQRRLRKWTSIHLHHGAEHALGRLAFVDVEALEAGETCIADCLIDQPILAKWGDRVLVRDAASEFNLGGGPVIDTCIAERKGRRWADGRLALLEALAREEPMDSLKEALSLRPLIDLESFCQLRNLSESKILSALPSRDIRCIEFDSRRELVLESTSKQAEGRILDSLRTWHSEHPEARGMGVDSLRKQSEVPKALLRDVISRLAATKRVSISSGKLYLPGFQARRSRNETSLLRALREADTRAPTLGDLTKLLSLDLDLVKQAAKRLESSGEIIFVTDRRIIESRTLDDAINLAKTLDSPEGFTVREFRDRSGYGRNSTIDILEYLDRTGITRRVGDRRHMNAKEG